jgi:N utilization substance protein B
MTQKSPHANPSKSRTPRHRAREFALQGLYQWLLNGEDAGAIEAHIREAHGFDKADAAHFDALLYGTIRQASELRAELSPLIDRPLAQVSPIEHVALLIGAYELKNHLEIPYRVVHKYVNGVLDKLAASVRSVEVDAARR